jgi:hypothetical protein
MTESDRRASAQLHDQWALMTPQRGWRMLIYTPVPA